MEKERFEDSVKKAFGNAQVSPTENCWTNISGQLEKARGLEIRDAFENAEVNPGEDAWIGIALQLEKSNGLALRRKILRYKMLAAAAVVFALSAAFGMYYVQQTESEKYRIALEQLRRDNRVTNSQPDNQPKVETQGVVTEGAVASAEIKKDAVGKGDANLQASKTAKKDDIIPTIATTAINDLSNGGRESGFPAKDGSVILTSIDKDKFLPLAQSAKPYVPTLDKKQPEVDPVLAMLARLEQREKEINKDNREDEKRPEERIWTSLGISAGSFDASQSPGVKNSSLNASHTKSALTYNKTAEEEATASGIAYSVGVSLGKKIADRWVLQGGVNYINQSSEYTSENVVSNDNFVSFRAASIQEIERVNVADATSDSKLATTAPYTANNTIRYLSVPLQAGYLVVDKSFGLQFNAGVSTDFFLENIVEADSPSIESSSSDGGDEESPYRSVNLSGLVGTELSYRFAKNYRVSLNPGIRYPLNNIYKSEFVEANPITFDIGLKFRYIFN